MKRTKTGCSSSTTFEPAKPSLIRSLFRSVPFPSRCEDSCSLYTSTEIFVWKVKACKLVYQRSSQGCSALFALQGRKGQKKLSCDVLCHVCLEERLFTTLLIKPDRLKRSPPLKAFVWRGKTVGSCGSTVFFELGLDNKTSNLDAQFPTNPRVTFSLLRGSLNHLRKL